jgi:hypothetical protein
VLRAAGFQTCAVWEGVEALESAVRQTRAGAIVYEVGYPFDEHWRALQAMRQRDLLKTMPFVIATGEPQALARQIGAAADLEIFVRPRDSEGVRAAVRAAITAAEQLTDDG